MTTLLTDLGLESRIASLDLSMVSLKLQDTDEGAGWAKQYADRVEIEYRRYLYLTGTYPDLAIVPSRTIDTFWHGHILDTHAYAPDCQMLFGYFLHHYPYFGMRDASDAAALGEAYDTTLQLYEIHFGSPPSDLWPRVGASRCPKCGNRCK